MVIGLQGTNNFSMILAGNSLSHDLFMRTNIVVIVMMDKLIFILLQAEYDTTSHVIKVKKGKEVRGVWKIRNGK